MISNETFLRTIFGDDWERAHVAAFRGDPAAGGTTTQQQNQARYRWIGNHAGRILRGFSDTENQYYVVSLFHEDYADRVTGRATRRKAQFRSMHIVVVDDVALSDDLGAGRKVRETDVLARMGEPAFRLLTSPGNCQFGYILRAPIAVRIVAEALVEQMIAAGLTADGVDPGMAGVTRYVRLPGGSNGKAKYVTPETPHGFKCRLLAWNPENRITPDAIARAWGFDLDAAVALKAEMDMPIDAPQREVVPYDPRWSNVFAAEHHPHAADFDPSDLEVTELRGTDDDPLLRGLRLLGLIKQRRGPGMFEITCPFVHEHTTHANNGTAYMSRGGIACHHGHCVGRGRAGYAAEVAGRLRTRGDGEARRVADMLSPRTRPVLFADPLRAVEVELAYFDKQRKKDGFDQRRALFRMALALGHYTAARTITDDMMCNEVAAALEQRGVPRAAWLSAWSWGSQTAKAHNHAA